MHENRRRRIENCRHPSISSVLRPPPPLFLLSFVPPQFFIILPFLPTSFLRSRRRFYAPPPSMKNLVPQLWQHLSSEKFPFFATSIIPEEKGVRGKNDKNEFLTLEWSHWFRIQVSGMLDAGAKEASNLKNNSVWLEGDKGLYKRSPLWAGLVQYWRINFLSIPVTSWCRILYFWHNVFLGRLDENRGSTIGGWEWEIF